MRRSDFSFLILVIFGLSLYFFYQKRSQIEGLSEKERDREQLPSTLRAQEKKQSFLASLHKVVNVERLKDRFKIKFLNSPSSETESQTMTFHLNAKAEAKPFRQVLSFLLKSQLHRSPYVLDKNDCKHYAQALFNSAQAKGFKTQFVALELERREMGHAVMAFETTDLGRVFVDFTPILNKERQIYQKRLVFVGTGEKYLSLPLSELDLSFQNSYSDYNEHYEKKLMVKEEIEDVLGQLDDLEEDIKEFNHTVKTTVFNREEAEVMNQESKDLSVEHADLIKRFRKLEKKMKKNPLPAEEWVVDGIKIFPEEL